MEIIYVLVSVISLVITILALIKFFQMASDLRSLKESLKSFAQLISDINFIKQRFDGEHYSLTEDRSRSELEFLIANGYNDEAKRMLLRRIWKLKANTSYREIKQAYSYYFTKIGLEFPSEEYLNKF